MLLNAIGIIFQKIKNFKKFEKFKTFGYELKNTEFVDLNTEDDLSKLKIYFKNKFNLNFYKFSTFH